jgi:hypothetical protein
MPYFVITDTENFFEVCNRCIEKVKSEALCLGYGFSVCAGPQRNMAFCRESFLNAEGVIAHLQNVEDLFKEGLCKYGDLVSLQIHGPKEELDILRQHPMIEEMCPEFYELMPGSFEVIELPIRHIREAEASRSSTPRSSSHHKAKVLGGGLSGVANMLVSAADGKQDRHKTLGQMPTTYMVPPNTRDIATPR